jgi:DNA ligase D-like protein (predicted ligase)
MPRRRTSPLSSLAPREAEFIEPMECALVSTLPEGPDWTYEVKLDGYRAIGVRTSRESIVYSRNGKNFNKRFPYIVEALSDLPPDTLIDGEVVALDDAGRPSFHDLQHFQAAASRIRYFVFDLLIAKGHDLTNLPLRKRRELLGTILKLRSSRVRVSEQFHVSADQMLAAVRAQHLEGVVAKRQDSLYEAGKRSGAWVKMRINKAQEFVIGGFIPGPHGVDSIIVGYRGKDLVYVARVRNGFVPATRRMVYEKLKPLITDKCPFVNLPETGRARWGEILDAEKMKKCVWVRPKLVAVIEFLEWTEGDRLRHSKFVALRDDKNPRDVVKEA